MKVDHFRKNYQNASFVNEFQELASKNKNILLKGLVGSATSFVSDAIIQTLNGNHLFILPDKEAAIYFFNDLENIISSERGTTLLFYPASYRRPYQIEEIDHSSVLQRSEVISLVTKKRKKLLIVTYPEAIIEKVITRKKLEKNTIIINTGEEVDLNLVNELLIELEFEKVDFVYQPGQFAVRGGILDVYSFSNENPYRIEFFGDEVESIREFNASDQLSIQTLQRIKVIPNINHKNIQTERCSFLDHLPADLFLWIKEIKRSEKNMEKGFEQAIEIFNRQPDGFEHISPIELYLAPVDFFTQLNKFKIIEIAQSDSFGNASILSFEQAPQPAVNKNFELLLQKLLRFKKDDYAVHVFAQQDSQIQRLRTIFKDLGHEEICSFVNIGLKEGYVDHQNKIIAFSDHQIFDRYHKFRIKEKFNKSQETFTLKEIYNLQKGDFVVHIDHGVGEFSGLQKIDVQGKEQEAIRLIYKGGDILYISIHSLHNISKFTGKDGKAPTLNKLGSPSWNLAKEKAKKKIKEVAFDLIKLYAKRKMKKGFAFNPDTYMQSELEASFIYEDTPDQLASTTAVKEDMEKPFPMDRLICGDVGFGKTEIAIRAAFKAVADNKQVAILVPTTVLAFQHFKTFSERLKNFPCNIDYINRFKTTKNIKSTIQALYEGKVDILIGTHRLISKDVVFKDLGLLIVDEEQKFGVSVKEQLKNLKVNVDTLTLTATPIPRTLQFSLMNARDLSIINTAPPNRFPVDTLIQTFSEETIKEAINYEIGRGGQVYFIHNRVQNINEVAQLIKRLCPDAKIAIGHGKLEGKKLEAIILDFMSGMYDVLVATTIVESGIDIPNANTIIINNANHFGLSDLHQLRGRVGRSNKKAFAYLFTPPKHHLSDDARKRLLAIEQFSELGSGFNIAMRDLDIRGAGDLLGANQSGFISEIGFDTYQKILDEAIQELKENEFKEVFEEEIKNKDFLNECVLETDLSLIIPDDYVNEINERIDLYKGLDKLKNQEEVEKYKQEMTDRFGSIPTKTEELILTVKLRQIARGLGFEKLILRNNLLIATFIVNNNSSYYQSEIFSSILKFTQNSKKGIQLKEKNNQLLLRIEKVNSVSAAIKILNEI
ncbi:MAG: transcription-repair coupling factor [Crocinitomicaceae bacterium]|nr:transcription-repair coupling factor [Crocinitomicaceae bacterium]